MPSMTPLDARQGAVSSIYETASSPTALALMELQSPVDPVPQVPTPQPAAPKRFAPQQPLLQQPTPAPSSALSGVELVRRNTHSLRYREDFVTLLADGKGEGRADHIKRLRLASPKPEIAPEFLPPTKRGRRWRAALLAGAALATLLGTGSWAFWQF